MTKKRQSPIDFEHIVRDELWDTLTWRERQSAYLLAQGKTTQEAAEVLGISIKTMDTHRSRVLAKLTVNTQTRLAHLALARGWVDNIFMNTNYAR